MPGPRPTARRPALDGIRAVAVLSVVVYHFGGGSSSVLPGGYLGVDAFFVLSGYLITSLLLAEHERTGWIDLVAFWARRVRRLLPAALLVLLAVAGAVWWFGPVQGWGTRRGDLLWTLAYLANWHFAASGEDYFALYTGASPLRHAWSLAVEEQFYLIWPLLTWGLLGLGGRWPGGGAVGGGAVGGRARGGARAVGIAAAVGVVGSAVAMASLYDPDAPSRAYYGTDGRVQELGVGVLLAVLLRHPPRMPRWAGPSGAATFVAALALLPDTSPIFYRGGALVVCAAVALVVADVERRPTGLLAGCLAWRPLELLGIISYGVYLWHWPLLVLLPGDGIGTQVARTVMTLGLATASYRLVERPIRAGRAPLVRRSAPRLAVATVLATGLVAAGALAATHIPQPYAAQLAEPSDRPCPSGPDGIVACVRLAGGGGRWGPDGVDTLVVLGDSTARAMDQGFQTFAESAGLRYVQAAWQRCTPTGLLVVPVGSSAPGAPEQRCAEQARAVQRRLLDAERGRGSRMLVLLADFWVHHQPLSSEGRTVQPGSRSHDRLLRLAYAEIVTEVRARGGRTALLTVPPPGPTVGAVVAAGRPAGRQSSRPLGSANIEGYNAVLREVASTGDGVTVVDMAALVCPDGRCPATADGVVLRYDGVHYTAGYARSLVPRLMAALTVRRPDGGG